MTLIDWIEKLDKILFLVIHRDADYEVLDVLFLLIRNALTWIPLYFFLLFYILKYIPKQALLFVALSFLTFAICDRVSAGFLKPMFERPRPCFDSELQPMIRNIIECGGLFSFPSSHAANHFGLATFWYLSIYSTTGKKWKWLWAWAFCIGYAQVYVCKHYPLDIARGAILGMVTGLLIAKTYETWPNFTRYVKSHILPIKSMERWSTMPTVFII